jgi:transposase
MRFGRPKKPLTVKPADLEKLELLARRPKTAQRVAIRSKIVLRAAEGLSNQEIARRLGVTGATVGKWRERYRLRGMEGLADEPRPGTPRKITDAKVEEAVTQTLESLPAAATHWSTRSLAEKVGLSQTAVVRIWHSFGLQPHRTETFKLSTDPYLVEKVRDIVGLYLNPPEHAIVLCVDEKSQVQALDPADFAVAARSAGTTDQRLRAARHDFTVCCPGRRHRQSHRRVPPSPSPPGVPQVPGLSGFQASPG